MTDTGVFFDLDGTLTDPKLGITRCIQHALSALDEPVPATEELLWCIGPPLRENFVTLIGEQRADQAVQLYRERFADVGLFENEPYRDIHTTLDGLQRRGAPLYVASSKPLVFVEQILERYELARHFQAVFGSGLDGTRVDKGELLEFALGRTGKAGEASVMIGDRRHDAIGAQRNGMAFIGVLYGYGDADELRSAGAETLADWHAQLLDLVR